MGLPSKKSARKALTSAAIDPSAVKKKKKKKQ